MDDKTFISIILFSFQLLIPKIKGKVGKVRAIIMPEKWPPQKPF
jgi:hypothetical protein